MEMYSYKEKEKCFPKISRFLLLEAFFRGAEVAKTLSERETLQKIMIASTMLLQMPQNSL